MPLLDPGTKNRVVVKLESEQKSERAAKMGLVSWDYCCRSS